MRYFLIALAGLFPACGFSATALEQAREKFAENRGKIEQAYAQAQEVAAADYLETLNLGRKAMQDGGHLDAVIEIRIEIDRFKKEGTMTAGNDTKRLKGIESARKRYLDDVKEARLIRDGQTAKLLTYYVKHLQQIQKQLVQQDLVKEAVLVRTEVARKSEVLDAILKVEAERKKAEAARRPVAFTPLPQQLGAARISPALMQGLIGHYTFDRKESRAITDRSRERNHGKGRELAWVPRGKRGGCIEFEFGKGHVELPRKMLSGVEAFTMAIWVQLPEYRGESFPAFISSYSGSASSNVGIGIYRDNGMHWVEVTTGDGNFVTLGKIAIPWSEWFHAGLVYDGKTLREYVNGQPGAVVKATGKTVDLSGLYIGSHGPKYSPKGVRVMMDEAMIFDRALSESEIQILYKSQK